MDFPQDRRLILDVVMNTDAIVGLAISTPLALMAGAGLIIWRKRVAEWYRNIFAAIGRIGDPFAKAASPRTVALVGCGFMLIGLFNGARLLVWLLS
jgi:hypothetical protein